MNVIKQCRNGLMLFNTNDVFIGKSLMNYGEFSHGEVELFEKFIKNGDTVLDIGANIGCHTIAFSKYVGNGRVFAYEPQRLPYYSLCANIALNNITNVYCLQNAVGRSEGRIDVPELDYRRENNFGGISLLKNEDHCEKCSIKMINLDGQNYPSLEFIKIDIEGMECEALSGARKTIMKWRPFIYVENDKSEYISLLVKIIKSLDYEIYFHAPPLYNSQNCLNNKQNIFGNLTSINMFCHPKEKPLEIKPEELNLTYLADDGKIIFQNNNENSQKLHDSIINSVIQSCIDAAIYYSDKLCEHIKALAFTDMAMRVNPEDFQGYYQAALIFCKMCDYNTALKFIDISLEKNPDHFKTLLNRATILGGLGRYEEAVEQYKEVIAKEPNAATTHFYLACALITLGRFEEGFKEYEWRFQMEKVKQFVNLLPNVPKWNGESLKNKKILLFCEQGGGDLIQFVRYIRHLKEGHISLTVPRNMIKLIEQCEGINEIISFNSDDGNTITGEFDYICSLLSLPNLFGIDESTKYIKPQKTDKTFNLDKKTFNIGFSWAGNDMHEHDYARSCHLKHFETLQDIPNVKLYSLQKGSMKRLWRSEGKVDLLEGSENVKFEDFTPEFEDFNDTANFINELDLIITVDTALAHVAAAMGKPVWLLMGFYPDYRWGIEKNTTIWYKSMKLFRQLNYGKDWNYIFEQVKKELSLKNSINYYKNFLVM